MILADVREKYKSTAGIAESYEKALARLESSPRYHSKDKRIMKHEAHGGTYRIKLGGNHRIYYLVDDDTQQVVVTRYGPKGAPRPAPKG